jgi:hypothetical protein
LPLRRELLPLGVLIMRYLTLFRAGFVAGGGRWNFYLGYTAFYSGIFEVRSLVGPRVTSCTSGLLAVFSRKSDRTQRYVEPVAKKRDLELAP